MRVDHDEDGNRIEVDEDEPELLAEQEARSLGEVGADGLIRLSVDGHPLTIDPGAVDEAGWSVKDLIYWSDWLGRARAELTIVESAYRAFRGKGYEAMNRANAKAAEWKIKAALEADPKYMELKRSIAECERNLIVLQGIVAAVKLSAPIAPTEPPL